MKKILTTLILVMLIVILAPNVYAKSPLNTDFVPEYLEEYTQDIRYMGEEDCIKYWGLAHYEGYIEINPVAEYAGRRYEHLIFHEIGHLVYWDIPWNDKYKNNEEVAERFVIEVRRTNSLKELMIAMKYIVHYNQHVDYQAQINKATVSGAGTSIITYLIK